MFQGQELSEFARPIVPGTSAASRLEQFTGWFLILGPVTVQAGDPSEAAPVAALPGNDDRSAVVDMRGCDTLRLMYLATPGSSNNPFRTTVNLLAPMRDADASQVIAWAEHQVYFSNTITLNSSSSEGPGSLAGSWGITANHRFITQNNLNLAATTHHVTRPDTTGNRGILNVWTAGNPFVRVKAWRHTDAPTHPNNIIVLGQRVSFGRNRVSSIG